MLLRHLGSLLISSVLVGMASPSRSEIYQCVDDKGESSFSDRPCGKDAEVLGIETRYAAPRESGLRESEREFLREREDRRRWEEQQALEKARLEERRREREAALEAFRDARKAQNQSPWWGYPSYGSWPGPVFPPHRPQRPVRRVEPTHGARVHRPPSQGSLVLPGSVQPKRR